VKKSLDGTASAWGRVFEGGDVCVASQANSKNIRWLNTSVSTAKVNPLSVPARGDDITKVNLLGAHIAGAGLIAEHGRLVASAVLVGALEVGRNQLMRAARTEEIQPAIAALVRAI
jgi:hypothetical protein